MCCEDVKINWHKKTEFQSINLSGVASQQVLGIAPHRWSIVFANPTANNVFLMPGTAAVSNGGIKLPANLVPVILTREDIGDLVAEAWFAFSTGAGLFFVTETLLLPGGPCKDLENEKQIYPNFGANSPQPGGPAIAKRIAAGF